jgi:hypothetical protein
MSKISRQRRQGLAKRDGRLALRDSLTRKCAAAAEQRRRDADRLRALAAQGTSTARFRELLADAGQLACPADFASTLVAHGALPSRLVRLAGELIDATPFALPALTFAAAVARYRGDGDESDRLLDMALAAAKDDAAAQAELAGILPGHDRLADALALLAGRLREDPGDRRAARRFGEAMSLAYGRGDDCEPRARAMLDAFTDRSALVVLHDAVTGWLCGDEGSHSGAGSGSGTGSDGSRARYKAAVDRRVADTLRIVSGQPGCDSVTRDLLADLAAETGLAARPAGTTGQAGDSALLAFAADPATPPALAARARAWQEAIRYGLWRIDDERPGPGRLCTDIVTGQVRYVCFPEQLRRELVSHAVWCGGVVPLGGGWHATGLGLRISPAEADAAADVILAGVPDEHPVRIGTAPPHGVAVDYEGATAEYDAARASQVAAAVLPRVLGEILRYRALVPAPRNSCEEPLCLIAARLSVADPAALHRKLLDRDDFEVHPADPATVSWLESARPGVPQVPLGTLRFVRTAGVLAQVNSCARFVSLCDLLTRLDSSLVVSSEKWIDPVLHTAWPDEMTARRAVSAEGWERFWIDRPLAVLGRRSPRHAAGSSYLPELLTLLRQFEYEAGLLALTGKSGVDVGLLRRELGLEAL